MAGGPGGPGAALPRGRQAASEGKTAGQDSNARTASITTNVQTNKDTKFRLKPLFLDVVRTVDGVNPKQIVFTYEEVNQKLPQKYFS